MEENVWNTRVAQHYDEAFAPAFNPQVLEPAVDFLARRTRDAPALEFAVGTGRVALPLRARGVHVFGIEMSEPMAAQLRAKPGGDAITVTIGDMATCRAPGRFGLVYAVCNAITCLLSQSEQVACFRNAARHLLPGGRFVVEVEVPDLQRLPPGEHARPFHVGPDQVGFDTFELADQRMVSHHYRFGGGGSEIFRSQHRFVWPSELDLMAQLAGLVTEGRWADFDEAPFTSSSRSHVSVWRKSSEGPG
ncbi:SAM-dependent methyltransferase [Nocardiopsis arvandica]|uniref:SAM-dependent methyltransferase n=1 Tax=Nocardiopsis sinuspersici TaxID=501010 RepID=A0A7Z0BMI7_9ACTN|nr:class I SAM-dependent methyltransferase [Nocardiopsis sinuspersici]NYH55335.1 SAM-dependent methyltransferase [Nocardiopsis sinuspersici]